MSENDIEAGSSKHNPTHLYRVVVAGGVAAVESRKIVSYAAGRFYVTDQRVHGRKDVDYVKRTIGTARPDSEVWFASGDEALDAYLEWARRAVVEARETVRTLESVFAARGLDADGNAPPVAAPAGPDGKAKAKAKAAGPRAKARK